MDEESTKAVPNSEIQNNTTEWYIEPRKRGLYARLSDLVNHVGLIKYFSLQAIQGIYMRTALGRLWLLIRPLFPVVVGVLVFHGILNAPSESVPYLLFFMCGMSAWYYFEAATLLSTRSLSSTRRILKSFYFPRIIIPISYIAPSLVYLMVYICFILILSFYYYVVDGTFYLRLDFGLLVALLMLFLIGLFAMAISLFTSVLEARAKDVRYGLRYFMRFWFFVTPVIYPMSTVDENLKWLMHINPMTSLIETYKWGLLGVGQVDVFTLTISISFILLLFLVGVIYFSIAEEISIDMM